MIYIQTSSRDNENMHKTLENAIPKFLYFFWWNFE